MKTPFTSEQFFEVFKNYNEAVFPMQIAFYLLSLIIIYLVIKPANKSDKLISSIIVFLWLWMGLIYHIYFFTTINKAAFIFGIIFSVQGFLFLLFGVFMNKLSFKYKPGFYNLTGFLMIFYALIIYPVFAFFFGHIYPSAPTFGLPCPTTIFTFGLLLNSDKKVPVALLIIPVAWSIVGLSAALNFGVYEDFGLLLAGLVALPMILFRNRSFRKTNVV